MQTKRLSDYYNTSHAPSMVSAAQNTSNSKSSCPNVSMLLPPPFLVAAVMDALNAADRYRKITIVVPGEADLYCARYLEQYGGIVLTGDSDLLVHDLGPEGAVCFFADIRAISVESSGSFNTRIFRPAVIADRLALPKPHGLHSLAFEILMDSQGTFRKLLAQAASLQSITKHKVRYAEFHQEYATLKVETRKAEVIDCSEQDFLQALRRLDPRVSEFVTQFPSIASLAGHDILHSGSCHVFLPFLLDCPVRTNSWERSTPVRQLAYSLINTIVPSSERQPSVYEYRRQQKNSGGREWQLPSITEIPDACSDLLARFDQICSRTSDFSHLDIWIVWAVYQDIEYSSFHSKPNLSSLAINQFNDIKRKPSISQNYTWDIIQFHAHVEGSYYSLRILKQIIGLLVTHSQSKQLCAPILLLHHRLKTLPPLISRRELSDYNSGAQLMELKMLLQTTHNLLGLDERRPPASQPAVVPTARKKRKKNAEHDSTARRQITNPFEFLEAE